MAIIAAFGVVITAAYILWMIQRVYLGQAPPQYAEFPEANGREIFILTPFAVLALALGIFPSQTLFRFMNGTQELAHELPSDRDADRPSPLPNKRDAHPPAGRWASSMRIVTSLSPRALR